MAVVVGAAVAMAGWTITGPGADDGDRGVPDDALSEIRERTADDTPTTLEEQNANQAFARASQRLEEAGSFAYSGWVATNDPPTDVSPGRSVEGEVLAPSRSRQVTGSGPSEPVIETLVVGPTIWERQAAARDGLDDATFAFVGDVVAPSGQPVGDSGALLPRWLRRTTDRRYMGTNGGERFFRATLPTEDFSPLQADDLEAATDAEVTVDLWVDANGDPTSVKIGISPTLVDLAITRIGEPVAIEPPSGKLPGVTDAVAPSEVQAAGLAEPVELARLPRGWMLTNIELLTDRSREDCATLVLNYAPIDHPGDGTIELTATPSSCVAEITDRSLTAGEFSGEPLLAANTAGHLTNGRTVVGFVSSLPMNETLTLLETLEPYDPSTRPRPL